MAQAGIVGQAGCATLAIVFVSLFGGLWLDGLLHTRPVLTLVLVLGSVPIAMYLSARVALRGVARFNETSAGDVKPGQGATGGTDA